MKVDELYFIGNNYLVEGQTFEKTLEFELNFTTLDPIVFKNCTFQNGMKISRVEKVYRELKMEFFNCNFLGEIGVTVSDSIMDRLSFENCTIESVNLRNSELASLSFENSEISEHFEMVECSSIFTNLKCNQVNRRLKEVRINSPKLEFLEIDWATDLDGVQLYAFQNAEINCSIGEVTVYEGDFEQLNFGMPTFDLSKNNSRIGKLSIGDIKQNGIVRVERVFISELNFDRIDATNGTYFFNETVVNETHIESCIFSKFYCNQLFFVNNPMILKSDVSSFDLNNLGWGKGKKLKGNEAFRSIPLLYWLRKKRLKRKFRDFDKDDIVELRDQKDTYRQLKKASLANKNNVDALQFHANEMQTYWKEVRITGDISFVDRVLVFLDRWVANFGQNWFLPLLWMFIFAFIFYSCILDWNYFGNNWTGGEEFGQFWVLFNPVHKTPDYINTGAGLFTEFVMRVFTGYFVYHFIRASRKFGKV